jgi:4a-hydroxytetrahydrobiopterin dehydratase
MDNWTRDGEFIHRTFTFADFPSAIAFIVRVGFTAEAADHHPDILLHKYKRVTLTYTTHSEKKLTQKDWDGAKAADQIAEGMTVRSEGRRPL